MYVEKKTKKSAYYPKIKGNDLLKASMNGRRKICLVDL